VSVYVDILGLCATSPHWRHRESCHLLADTVDELHTFADRIGLKRSWFQPRSSPHYDLTRGKRTAAVKLGAIEFSNREMGVYLLGRRQHGAAGARRVAP
jgi:hypothetical protein